MHSWGKLEHLFMWGTITVFELVFLFFCTVPTFSFLETSTYNWNTMLYVMPTLYTQPAFWFTMVLTIALALFPRFVGKATHALQELTPAKRVLREIAANNRRAQSRLRRSVEIARVHNLTASGRITVEPSAGSAQLSAQRSTGVAVSAQSMSAATGSYGSRGDDAPPTVSGRARSLSTSQSFSTRKSGFAFSTHEATTNSVFASLGAMNASFVAGDTLKGNVDSMRSPRGARASPTLGSVKEASQRRSDAPAPQACAVRKASAVSNVI